MSTKFRLLSLSAVAVTMLYGGTALALTTAEQKCLDGYNNKLRLVGQQAGKDYRKVIQSAGKNKAPFNVGVDAHITADTPAKIAGKVAKVTELYSSGKCTGAEPIQQGAGPGSAAQISSSQDLVRAVFGDPILDGTVVNNPGRKCQDKAYQRAEQLYTEKLKAFRKCKKDNMKSGAVVDSVSLEAVCASDPQPFAIPDPAGKQAGKAAKLLGDVAANCGPPVVIGSDFPGDCGGSANPAALGACIERLVECHVCRALNAADGMTVNCDLFDDGLANGSCGIDEHKCNLNTTNCVPASNPLCGSKIEIHIEALPVPLRFALGGSLDIGAGGPIGTCDIQMLNPVTIPMIGVVCIQPSSGCPVGVRHCGPGAGPALGIDVQSDGNAGACTSNPACVALAPAACLTNGPNYVPLTTACTGYCSGGAGAACTSDDQCASLGQNACNGPDPIGANGNICQVSCIDTVAHGPSDPGDQQCNLGSNLEVETAAPCDGTDTTIVVGQTCIPVSSQRASSLITDANFNSCGSPPCEVPPPPNVNDLSGLPLACATLDTSTTTGFRGVGAVNFFGSALGDLAVGIMATCL